RLALLDSPWRRPAVRAQGSQAAFHPRANGPVAARPRRDADRRRPGRKPDGLPPPVRSDHATRRDGEGAAHPAALCGGDGGDARARSLEGLSAAGGSVLSIEDQPSLHSQRLALVRLLQERYGIPTENIYAHNWIDFKDNRYCEGCELATLA